jgi:hypothetical protein
MAFPITQISPWTSVFSFIVGFPTLVAAYYQSWKTRQEARRAREGTLHSRDCLEFVAGDGTCINLVPLETLTTLPRVGDVILLPGHGTGVDGEFLTGAYLVERVEQLYTRAEHKGHRPQEARLTKAVALVTSLNPAIWPAGSGAAGVERPHPAQARDAPIE